MSKGYLCLLRRDTLHSFQPGQPHRAVFSSSKDKVVYARRAGLACLSGRGEGVKSFTCPSCPPRSFARPWSPASWPTKQGGYPWRPASMDAVLRLGRGRDPAWACPKTTRTVDQ